MLHKTLTEARKDMPEIFNKVCYGGERAIIQKHGKDSVAVVPVLDLRVIEYIEDIIDIKEVEQAIAEAEKKGTKSFDVLLRELGLKKD